MASGKSPRRWLRIAVHGGRLALFAAVLALLHFQHKTRITQAGKQNATPLALSDVLPFYPAAARVDEQTMAHGGQQVFDGQGQPLGYVLQTSPDSDHIIGFSGPTNAMLAFDQEDRIVAVAILSSRDTKDHVRQIRDQPEFLDQYRGKSWKSLSKATSVDTVSGATLTSYAIHEALVYRLAGKKPSLRFPDALTASHVKPLFPAADRLTAHNAGDAYFDVWNRQQDNIGSVLRTSPAADNIVGYQGPTETLIGFDRQGRVIGLLLQQSYDNEPYVTYVRDDSYFLNSFNELLLPELAAIDLQEAQVEGVSGATMTSMAVARGVLQAANELKNRQEEPPPQQATLSWSWRDWGTAVVIGLGTLLSFTSLRGNKPLRIAFQFVLIGYLGLINGDMLSQAMIVGWAQHGIPWRLAGGLLLLTCAAFAIPLTTGRNTYCTHLCPHGAVQHLVMKRLPWRWQPGSKWTRWLRAIPVLLLAWCILVAMLGLGFSLVDIEPFDAWVFYVAGLPTILVAIIGIVASLFVPMAYCRYGCPTGTVLNYLRYHSRSDRWTRRDWVAVGLLLLAVACWAGAP